MTTKFLLTEDELPSHWYNILADVPEPLGAFLSPRTLEPLTPPDLTPIFPMAIIGQEVSTERWIEIPDRVADYQRIDAAQALALLRELPDPRLVRRLHVSDERSFLDPWARKVSGEEFFYLGHATNFSLIVLYRPDRRLGQLLGTTLLHEWLHLVAFASTIQLWRFKRANAIEPLPPLAFEPLNLGDRNTGIYEAWCDLGEKLLGYDESVARQTAFASPVHAIILWRCIERMLRGTPLKLRSTRFDELMKRGDFMRTEIEPKARALRTAF